MPPEEFLFAEKVTNVGTPIEIAQISAGKGNVSYYNY